MEKLLNMEHKQEEGDPVTQLIPQAVSLTGAFLTCVKAENTKDNWHVRCLETVLTVLYRSVYALLLFSW